MKNVHHFSRKQHEGMKSGISWWYDPKTRPSRRWCVLVHCPVGRCKSQAIPRGVWKWSFWAFSVAAMVKHKQFVISEPDEVHH